MREVYALRVYKSLFLYHSGLHMERLSFKDMYSLVDTLKDKHLTETVEQELDDHKPIYECLHYAPISGESTIIAYFQKG